ncbi:MAG: NAD(P)/FAD-dependent oxidoreductase [Planctomycetales bacterium]|nr:NAD(P)/FAD-dependent oxidoreductase [Planctomycetales bacterium]
MELKSDVIVVGAGAAGLLTAISAAERGLGVTVLEKNRKPGAKILMSGGTRCNVTQDTDNRGILDAFHQQGRFLRTAVGRFGPDDVVQLLADEGVETKIESTGKIFPASDRAFDVLTAFRSRLSRTDAELITDCSVTNVIFDKDRDLFTVEAIRGAHVAANVVLTTGGMSFPGCGTTGDGYAWAKSFGHEIVPPKPALVPLTLRDSWATELSGLTLPDAGVAVKRGNKIVLATRGSLLFTHFGLSGPAALDVSRAITTADNLKLLTVTLDFMPGYAESELDAELETADNRKRTIASLVADWIPKRLASIVCEKSEVAPEQRIAELSKKGRTRLIQHIKSMPVSVNGTMGFKKAEVTTGGVSLQSVDAKTMCSKYQPGLYFAGEILDIDGPIGGYNFQAAFSTGWLAGQSIAKRMEAKIGS